MRKYATALLIIAAILAPLISMATSYCFTNDPNNDLMTGLVSYWPMEGNSNDFYTTANNGADTAVTYSSSTPFVGEYGSYNGSTSKSVMGATSVNGSPFTIVSAFNPSSKPTSGNEFVIAEFGGASNGGALLELNGDGHFYGFLIKQSAIGVSSAGISNGTWHLGGESYDGSTQNVYLDGSSVASSSGVGYSSAAGEPFTLGHDNDVGGRFWPGLIDQTGIWARVLSASDMAALWNGGAGDTMTNTCGGGGAIPPATVWSAVFLLGMSPSSKKQPIA